MDRDGGRCLHCGATEGLVPQHRINRGAGGSKALEIPSNVVLFCSQYNVLIESDAEQAEIARGHGWKLSHWDQKRLKQIPVYDRAARDWFYLDDDYHRWMVE